MWTSKVSCLCNPFFQDSVIYYLIKKLSKKIEITSSDKVDILIVGPYNFHICIKKIFKELKKYIFYLPSLEIVQFKR